MVLKKDKDRMWKQAIDFSHDKALEFTKVMPILEDWKNKKILDFGCGAGRDCLKLALLGVKVYGLDISKSNIESAKKLFKKNKLNGNFKLINVGDEIPYTDDFFDGFICNGVLHHIKNPNDSLSEISRVLKNGGLGYIMLYTENLLIRNINTVENMLRNSPEKTWQNCFGEITDKCEYSTFYSVITGIELITSNNFNLKDLKDFHEFHFRVYKLENNKY